MQKIDQLEMNKLHPDSMMNHEYSYSYDKEDLPAIKKVAGSRNLERNSGRPQRRPAGESNHEEDLERRARKSRSRKSMSHAERRREKMEAILGDTGSRVGYGSDDTDLISIRRKKTSSKQRSGTHGGGYGSDDTGIKKKKKSSRNERHSTLDAKGTYESRREGIQTSAYRNRSKSRSHRSYHGKNDEEIHRDKSLTSRKKSSYSNDCLNGEEKQKLRIEKSIDHKRRTSDGRRRSHSEAPRKESRRSEEKKLRSRELVARSVGRAASDAQLTSDSGSSKSNPASHVLAKVEKDASLLDMTTPSLSKDSPSLKKSRINRPISHSTIVSSQCVRRLSSTGSSKVPSKEILKQTLQETKGEGFDSKLRAFLNRVKQEEKSVASGHGSSRKDGICSPETSLKGETKNGVGSHQHIIDLVKSKSGKSSKSETLKKEKEQISSQASTRTISDDGSSPGGDACRGTSLAFEIMNFASLVKNGQLGAEMHNIKRCPLGFRQSTILSLKAETILKAAPDPSLLRDHGTNCFEPFFIEAADVMYEYPGLDHTKDESLLGPEVLSAFCFPYGVSVRFFPRAAWEGAKRFGWIGEKGDKYQLKAFTSMTGTTKHGMALVVQDELKFDSEVQRRKIMDELRKRISRRRAVRKLVIWWKRVLQNRIANIDSPFLNDPSNKSMSAAVQTVSYLMNFMQGSTMSDDQGACNPRRRSLFRHRLADTSVSNRASFTRERPPPEVEVGQSEISLRWPEADSETMKNREISNQNFKTSHSYDDPSVEFDKKDYSPSERRNFATQGVEQNMILPSRRDTAAPCEGNSSVMEAVKRGALFQKNIPGFDSSISVSRQFQETDTGCAYKDSYRIMIENEQLGYAIVVETCYVFTDVHPEQQVPLFCAMQQIIEKQREHHQRFENEEVVVDYVDNKEDEQTEKEVDFAFRDHYDVLFDYLHKNMSLSYRQARISLPRNPYDLINKKADRPQFSFKLPLKYFDKRSLPLPLPNMTLEYGLSRLLLTIRHEALLMVLKVLLLERSVLVIGRNVEEVTCCTCTLLRLLVPFTWASAFMPLIRSDMLEFVSSPVPFLAGMVARDIHQLESIKNDSCIKEAVKEGLSIIDLYRGRLTVTSADGIWEMLVDSHLPCEKLMNYQARLEFLAQNPDSTLHSFKNFFKMGLAPKEQLTLHSVKEFLADYLINLANAAVDSSQQLEMFSRIDEETDVFEFEYDEFAELRRKQVLARVTFFDEMSKTQLFLGYVEENCRILYRRKELLRGIEAMVIASWLTRRWRKYKQSLIEESI